MKFLTLARTILALLPSIIAAIQAVEAAIPGEGKGEAKLALIREILQKIYEQCTDLTADFEKIWPALAAAIGAIVASFNALGVWNDAPDGDSDTE
jgi:hypothetical protein